MTIKAILDIDGTLVDSNYQHTLCWQRALRAEGATVPAWRIHRHIGMGGDQIVSALVGEGFDAEHGDAAREAESELFMQVIEEVAALPGARDLVVALKDAGHAVVLASSAKEQEVDHYLDLLDARDLADAWTTSADVEATKPAPDLVQTALETGGDHDTAIMVGDTVWDCEAAGKAGVPVLGVLSGGFAESELREAGAVAVFSSPAELLEQLGSTPLGR